MGILCYSRTTSGNFSVPSNTKCIVYYAVGGGGGGALPNNEFRPNYRYATAGGPTCIYSASVCGGGGGPGNSVYGLAGNNSGGYGGRGNWRNGQRGYFNNSGPDARARSGYGPYGTGGAGQWRSGTQSYGGGGGGASCKVVARNSSGAVPGQIVRYSIGPGGQQGGRGFRRYGDSGAFYATVYTYDRPNPSISANPLAFRLDGSDGSDGTVDLTWSTSGGETTSEILEAVRNGVAVTCYGQVARNRSTPFVVSPTQTTCYRLTTSNPAYSESDYVAVSVYIKPEVTFTTDDETLILGQSTRLRWATTGDANSLSISPGIGSVNLAGNTRVSPTTTTKYRAVATGLGGTGTAEVEIAVLQPPTISVNGPVNVDYGNNVILSISATNAPGGINAVATYYFTDGSSEQKSQISIPNSSGDNVEIAIYRYDIDYGDFGPQRISITFTVDGYGDLSATDTIEIPVIIDITPDLIDIPESEETIKDEEPVITPDAEVTSLQVTITDIDIPVEVKADYPIQIDIDNSENWLNIRKI